MVVPRPGQIAAVTICVMLAAPLAGCVSVAEYRKLERDVHSMKTRDGGGSANREQMADMAARMDSLETELRRLRGQVEVSDHKAASALDEARKARRDAGGSVGGPVPGTEDAGVAPSATEPAPLGSTASDAGPDSPAAAPAGGAEEGPVVARTEPGPSPQATPGASGEEVTAYRSAFAAWQRNDADACIDLCR
jgi:TolA-binding protein